MRNAILLAAAIAMTGCATAPAAFPTEVTRYRADAVPRGTVSLAPEQGIVDGPEFESYARAVGDALAMQGYTVVPAGANATYIARIGFAADTRTVRGPAPFTLGLGVGTFSGGRDGGVGVSGGGGIPIGKGKLREDTNATLSVRINARAGDLGVWEGRAQSRSIRTVGAAAAVPIAVKLANAMFTGFPGESGRTITVK